MEVTFESFDARAIPPAFDALRFPRGTVLRIVPRSGPIRYVLYVSTGECWRPVRAESWPLAARDKSH